MVFKTERRNKKTVGMGRGRGSKMLPPSPPLLLSKHPHPLHERSSLEEELFKAGRSREKKGKKKEKKDLLLLRHVRAWPCRSIESRLMLLLLLLLLLLLPDEAVGRRRAKCC